jgi:Pyruvate/2-oxoacid:ferredoxin oxidoreductase delta subunit
VTDERVIPSSSGSLESVVTMTSTTTTKPVATKPVAPQLAEAHKHASQHRVEIEASTCCGCFFCFRTFPPLSIKAWIDARQTALCPGCGVDSVLGNASSHRIDDAFLRRMHGQFFVRRSK